MVLLLVLGGGAGLLVLTGLVGFAVWAWSGDPHHLIIGTWKLQDEATADTVEFQRDGTFVARTSTSGTVKARYRFIDDTTVEIEIRNPAYREPQPQGFARIPRLQQQPQVSQTLRVTFTIVKLTRSELITNTASDGTKRFKRVN
jgi:hypothetical protein